MREFLADNLVLVPSALMIEAVAGYPQALLARVGHPATWFGTLIHWLDHRLNRESWTRRERRLAGGAALAILAVAALAPGAVLQAAAAALPFGTIALALLVSSLLAQRSLHEHVADVARALDVSLETGRASVSRIVGRDTSRLDEAGVARAAIESLAENFSDGVVAPAIFMGLLGLPGALIYKAINTADSMIGHRTMRHEAFGWASARTDDALNLLPARLAAALIVASATSLGPGALRGAVGACQRDAKKHLSPNAGWPESAMAGALGLRLGGPRAYGGTSLDGAWLGSGRIAASAKDIRRALALYRRATALLWLLAALPTLLLLLLP